MASTTGSGGRPLSPHLSVYRFRVSMIVSVMHRITGTAFIGGCLILSWGLIAAASGPEAYQQFHDLLSTWLGRLILFALTFAFYQHFATGLRHLYLDTGAGYEVRGNIRLAGFTLVASTVATVVTWAFAYGLI